MTECEHIDHIITREPNSEGCEECIQMGDSWVHLRTCLTCGQVGCCDDSKNKHATRHYLKTKHPLIASKEPGETWGWCFVDRQVFDPIWLGFNYDLNI